MDTQFTHGFFREVEVEVEANFCFKNGVKMVGMVCVCVVVMAVCVVVEGRRDTCDGCVTSDTQGVATEPNHEG